MQFQRPSLQKHRLRDDGDGRDRDNRSCSVHRDHDDGVHAHGRDDGRDRDNRSHSAHRGRDDGVRVHARDDDRDHDIRSHSVHRDHDDGVRAHGRDDARDRGIRSRSAHRGRDDGDDVLPQEPEARKKVYLFLRLSLQSACRRADSRVLL